MSAQLDAIQLQAGASGYSLLDRLLKDHAALSTEVVRLQVKVEMSEGGARYWQEVAESASARCVKHLRERDEAIARAERAEAALAEITGAAQSTPDRLPLIKLEALGAGS